MRQIIFDPNAIEDLEFWVKENKKKVKEKIKESKSWITKKSKEKVQDIKEKLKKLFFINII